MIFEKIASDKNSIYVEREIESGHRDKLELKFPALLTIQSGINSPRWPSLSNLLRANSQGLKKISTNNLAKVEHMDLLTEVIYPQKCRAGLVLSGSLQEKADRLLMILRDKSLL